MSTSYPKETLDEFDDDGTIVSNVDTLAGAVVGHRIVKAEKKAVPHRWYPNGYPALVIELDNGKQVRLRDNDDCCAFTELEAFLLHADKIDHMILGVGTTDGYTKWHIYADMGDVLELTVGWSCGNPFYYGYGFEIDVVDLETEQKDVV